MVLRVLEVNEIAVALLLFLFSRSNDLNTIDIEDVARRAKGLKLGEVSPVEVEFAREILRNRDGGIFEAIWVIGLCGTQDDAPLLSLYLKGEENTEYAEDALKAICRYLGLIDPYRALVREWMQDKSDDVRRMSAIFLTGEYFRNYKDDELGCYLVQSLCDYDDDCRHVLRGALVDLFDLEDQLDDPHPNNLDEWDKDMSLIVSVAAAEFGLENINITHPAIVH